MWWGVCCYDGRWSAAQAVSDVTSISEQATDVTLKEVQIGRVGDCQ